jgi:hypothetical protein
MAIIAFFIGLRFVFGLLAVNQSTPFVAWIYSVSNSLIYPFAGILPNFSFGQGVFDLVALVALLAYTIGFYLLTAFIDALIPTRRVYYTDRERVIE